MTTETKERVKVSIGLIGLMVFQALLMLGMFACGRRSAQSDDVISTTDTITFYDTVCVYKPIPKDSIVLKYKAVKLPVDTTCFGREDNFPTNDSVTVVLPIVRKEYQDSTYHAWVSGYDVSIDSIQTYSRHDVTTIQQTPRLSTKHWHIGVTGGYGFTPQGLQPFIGVGISYSLISF